MLPQMPLVDTGSNFITDYKGKLFLENFRALRTSEPGGGATLSERRCTFGAVSLPIIHPALGNCYREVNICLNNNVKVLSEIEYRRAIQLNPARDCSRLDVLILLKSHGGEQKFGHNRGTFFARASACF